MKCADHPRYEGATPPNKLSGVPDRNKCQACWRVYWENHNIPYNPNTLRGLAKIHQQYFQLGGKQVQGITTVIGNHNGDKGGMIYRAWDLGCQGIDYNLLWTQLADTGVVAHEMVRAHLLEIDYNPTDLYGNKMVDNALVAFKGFLQWKEGFKEFEILMVEEPIVSEELPYGATLDLYAILDGLYSLIDIKTGAGIYWNNRVQLAGQKRLLNEAEYQVDQSIILHLKRGEEREGEPDILPEFHEYHFPNLSDELAWFELICRANTYYNRIAKGWK